MQEPRETAARAAEAVFNRSALTWLASNSTFDNQAASKLSVILAVLYRDRWLADILEEIQDGRTDRGSVRALRDAAEANVRGDPDGALRALGEAGKERAGEACRRRMEFERVYAMHRSFRAKECLNGAERLRDEVRNKPYPWLKAQTAIEHATCAGLLGAEGQASLELQQTERELQNSGFTDVRLRASGIRADVETNAGDPWAAWPISEAVLSEWWASAAAPNRAHQVLFDLSRASQYLDYPGAAWMFGKSAVGAIADTPNALTEAIGHTRVAALAENAGFNQEEVEELRRSDELFRGLQGEVVTRYRLFADIAMSSAEAARGNTREALWRIKLTEQAFPTAPTFQIEFDRSRLTGLIYEEQGETALAEQALCKAIRLAAQRVKSLGTKRERLSAVGESADVFRCLVKLLLEQKHDPEAAYRAWYTFLTASESPGMEIASRTILPAAGNWTGYVRLDGRYAIWLATPEGVRWFWAPARAEEIEGAVQRVLSSSADPVASARTLERDARWLFDQLLGEVTRHIKDQTELLIVPDSALMELPFNVLQSPMDEYLADKYVLAMGSGIRASGARPSRVQMNSALIVSEPLARTPGVRLGYLSDSGAETASVRRYFHAPAMLEGEDATLRRVEQMNPMPEVFHFSGHGFSNGGHGALVLANEPGNTAPSLLTPERISAMNFEGCRLAVLSACLTATGERQGPANPESLVRALLMAGAREVVASRWSVDSNATRQLMEEFYAQLSQGASAPDALRAASARVRASYGHPYYWAGFQVFH